jgi:hypothetical protein
MLSSAGRYLTVLLLELVYFIARTLKPLWGIFQSGCYARAPILHFQDSDSMVLCDLHSYTYACMLIASRTWNVHGTGCHESTWLSSTCSLGLKH